MVSRDASSDAPDDEWGLTPGQFEFAHNLLKGMCQKDAYLKAGYASAHPYSHASRLARNGKVKAYLEYRREQAFGSILDTLMAAAKPAAAELAAATAEEDPSSARVSAAKAVLDQVLNFYTKHQLEQRFARVEDRVNEITERTR